MGQIRETLAKNLKALRKSKGWTQDELAEQSGLSLDSIRNIEGKRAWVSSESVEALAVALGASVEDLFHAPAEPSGSVDDLLERMGKTATELQLAAIAPPPRELLIGKLVGLLPAIDDDKLRALLGHATAYARAGSLDAAQDLPDQKRKLK
jgi:transcriptional regulator with XRE-family HTH domain